MKGFNSVENLLLLRLKLHFLIGLNIRRSDLRLLNLRVRLVNH